MKVLAFLLISASAQAAPVTALQPDAQPWRGDFDAMLERAAKITPVQLKTP